METSNPVEVFLKERPTVAYSTRKLARKIGLTRRKICYYVRDSKNIRKVDPIEVGSGCFTLSVFTYKK